MTMKDWILSIAITLLILAIIALLAIYAQEVLYVLASIGCIAMLCIATYRVIKLLKDED